MGNNQLAADRGHFTERLEARVGKLPITARFHKAPQQIKDDYVVHSEVLGSGSTGVVRLARSMTTMSQSQRYAVKEIELGSLAPHERRELESEVEIFLAMDHPHIARLFDVYESGDTLSLVMECCEGGALFDRVVSRKRFSERDARDAVWQMLLALNYIHCHGTVHRDLKLENFMCDVKDSTHLKLIDFGFSKMWDPKVKMQDRCGTLSYVAPEVLSKSYTSQCDLWSLGVIAFILLSGYMPFSGAEVRKRIAEGKYTMKPDRWNSVSKHGTDFVKSLLEVNPAKRLTASSALEHVWILARQKNARNEVDESVVDALRRFGQASGFRRCCVQMMAWSLSNEQSANVRQYFISMDHSKQGTITLSELRQVLVQGFHVPDEETRRIFDAMDSNGDEEIHYSDFLAAMVSTRIALHDDLLRGTFKRFDTDATGYITADNLRQVLGESFEGQEVASLLAEADQLKDNRISYVEFASYLRGERLGGRGAPAPSAGRPGPRREAPQSAPCCAVQ